MEEETNFFFCTVQSQSNGCSWVSHGLQFKSTFSFLYFSFLFVCLGGFLLLDGVCCLLPQLRVFLKRRIKSSSAIQGLINCIQTFSNTFLPPILKSVGQWGFQRSICSSAWSNHGPGKCSPASDLNLPCFRSSGLLFVTSSVDMMNN